MGGWGVLAAALGAFLQVPVPSPLTALRFGEPRSPVSDMVTGERPPRADLWQLLARLPAPGNRTPRTETPSPVQRTLIPFVISPSLSDFDLQPYEVAVLLSPCDRLGS